MRKWIAWIWLLVMCVGLFQGALAEPMDIDCDWVMFDGSSAYAYAVPKGWVEIEATAEETAAGQVGKWQSLDQKTTMAVSVEAFSNPEGPDDPLTVLIKEGRYPGLEMDDQASGYFAHYENSEEGIHGWITTMLDDDYNQYFVRLDFAFATQDDESLLLARSILNYFRENMNEVMEGDDW